MNYMPSIYLFFKLVALLQMLQTFSFCRVLRKNKIVTLPEQVFYKLDNLRYL